MVLLATNENDLQTVLKAMCEWSKLWRLKVNAEKTKVVHFRPKRKNVTSYNFVYDGNNIERVSEYKYLGVYLDEFLKYDKCTCALAESAGRALGGVITKFRNLTDCGYKTFTR